MGGEVPAQGQAGKGGSMIVWEVLVSARDDLHLVVVPGECSEAFAKRIAQCAVARELRICWFTTHVTDIEQAEA